MDAMLPSSLAKIRHLSRQFPSDLDSFHLKSMKILSKYALYLGSLLCLEQIVECTSIHTKQWDNLYWNDYFKTSRIELHFLNCQRSQNQHFLCFCQKQGYKWPLDSQRFSSSCGQSCTNYSPTIKSCPIMSVAGCVTLRKGCRVMEMECDMHA